MDFQDKILRESVTEPLHRSKRRPKNCTHTHCVRWNCTGEASKHSNFCSLKFRPFFFFKIFSVIRKFSFLVKMKFLTDAFHFSCRMKFRRHNSVSQKFMLLPSLVLPQSLLLMYSGIQAQAWTSFPPNEPYWGYFWRKQKAFQQKLNRNRSVVYEFNSESSTKTHDFPHISKHRQILTIIYSVDPFTDVIFFLFIRCKILLAEHPINLFSLSLFDTLLD